MKAIQKKAESRRADNVEADIYLAWAEEKRIVVGGGRLVGYRLRKDGLCTCTANSTRRGTSTSGITPSPNSNHLGRIED